MNGYLPYVGFKWLKNVDNFDVNSIIEKSPIRYIFKFDLEYPDELHLLHNDYPLAPQKIAISYDMLSDYCKIIAGKYGIKVSDVMKSIPNLLNKTNHILHYRSLQLYQFLGIKLTKIHRVLKFEQSDWMKNYIDFNTKKRTNAANSFEKIFFKLMINCVYGKPMENLQKTINVRLVNNDKNYADINEIMPVLTLNKPICAKFIVLELTKWLMYDFYYDLTKKYFDAELLFTHTSSLTYE